MDYLPHTPISQSKIHTASLVPRPAHHFQLHARPAHMIWTFFSMNTCQNRSTLRCNGFSNHLTLYIAKFLHWTDDGQTTDNRQTTNRRWTDDGQTMNRRWTDDGQQTTDRRTDDGQVDKTNCLTCFVHHVWSSKLASAWYYYITSLCSVERVWLWAHDTTHNLQCMNLRLHSYHSAMLNTGTELIHIHAHGVTYTH